MVFFHRGRPQLVKDESAAAAAVIPFEFRAQVSVCVSYVGLTLSRESESECNSRRKRAAEFSLASLPAGALRIAVQTSHERERAGLGKTFLRHHSPKGRKILPTFHLCGGYRKRVCVRRVCINHLSGDEKGRVWTILLVEK